MILRLFSYLFLILSFPNYSIEDYDYKLNEIARGFKSNIWNDDSCEDYREEAEDIADEIEELLDEDEDLSRDEIVTLKLYKKEAEALEAFVGAVGDCGTYIPSIEQFQSANDRVGAVLSYFSKNTYCVDIVKVSLNRYVTYFAENNRSSTYTVDYSWKNSSNNQKGNGTMGIKPKSMRQMINGQDVKNLGSIIFTNVSCKTVNSYYP